MDRRDIKERITARVGKYKYVLLVVLGGIFLMVLPEGSGETSTSLPR